MPKQLQTAKVDSKFCLTVRELGGFLNGLSPDATTVGNNTPILLRCGGKNFRLAGMKIVAGKPVLVGKRTLRD